MTAPRWPAVGRVLAHVLFWGWNLLFFAVLWLGLGPEVLADMFVASLSGMVPWPWPVFGGVLLLLPLASMGLAWFRLRHDAGRMLSMFYGVQAPLMLLCLVRLFAIQQLTWATGLTLLLVGVGILGLLRTLLSGVEEPSDVCQVLRLVAQSTYAVVGLWVALVVGLYGLGVWGRILGSVFEISWSWPTLEVVRALLWAAPWFAFGAFTLVVMALFPFAALGVSLRAWQVVFRATEHRVGRPGALGTSVLCAVSIPVLLTLASPQPQQRVFAQLDAVATDADRRDALADTRSIERGLLGAFLAPQRWLDADPDSAHMAKLWEGVVGETLATVPQAMVDVAMSPFAYDPVTEGQVLGGLVGGLVPADVPQAEARYGAFFDVPLRRAERERLVVAVRQTWNWRDAQAGLIDVGEQKVHLHRQDLDVQPDGDWARVTVHDVYRNRTWQQQEVFVAFSLPESAALTGLWLGPTDDRDQAFPYVVAPRGAAQEVYQSEVRRRVDPALLEQVGPRQYRLRAFPVEPRLGDADDVFSIRSEGPDLHLWLEMVVPRLQEGGEAFWPLPAVAEARNLFWDRDTDRSVPADGWLPASVPAPQGIGADHRAVVGGLDVRAIPASDAPTGRLPSQLRVLVDGTRSMDAHRDAITDALEQLGARASLSVLCTREARVGSCPDFDAADALFWGARPLEAQIDAARAHGGGGPLVVLTDAGSYELADLEGGPVSLDAWPAEDPLWLLHLGGVLPAAYPDPTLDALARSGGGVAASVAELLDRLSDPHVRDGFRWSVALARDGAASPSSEDPFAQAAARYAIGALAREAPAGSLEHLDQVHALAVTYEVVTPYSSMIVLVNARQREALAEAETREDRFEREVVTGAPDPAAISSVPEPGTWLLLGLGGALLAGSRRRAGHAPPRGIRDPSRDAP